MDLTLMVEGQEGVGWPDWLALAGAAEELGFEGLLRSDHYFSVSGAGERGALDAWGTVNALAAVTERIRLGTLVSPVTFRPAAVLAKLALTADHVSGGRIDVGMGTGWWQAEHDAYGLPFPPMGERMDELERQLEAVTRLWADTRPAPVQQPRPRIVMGGAAKPRGARLAARYADEYNLVSPTPAVARERFAAVDAACEAAGRDPAAVRRSVMVGFVVGEDAAAVRERARRTLEWLGQDGGGGLPEGWLHGTPDDVVGQIEAFAEAGVQRIVLQHNLFRDLEALALVGRDVLPRVRG
jgi:alkanesulfonate monooxygenase SsuD/methylene tetrahydromethanopterin reductase-like flavin-dependent oxidoreductase (luciferase family)